MNILLSVSIITLLVQYQASENFIIIGTIYTILSFGDLVNNLIPQRFSTTIENYEELKTDGLLILESFRLGKHLNAYQEARKMYYTQDEQLALTMLKKEVDNSNNLHLKEYYINLLLDSKDYQLAYEYCQELFHKREPSIDQFRILGDVYAGLGQKEDAIKYYSTYLYHRIDNYTIKNKKAILLYELNEKKAAFTLFNHSINQNSENNSLAFLYLGKIYSENNVFDKATLCLDKAEAQNAKNAKIKVSKAQLYEKMGNNSKALEFYLKAKELGSTFHGLEYKIATICNN